MAGLFTRLGGTAFPIEAMGYTVAKHGAVALTRAIRDSEPSLYQTDGIKSYAICPFFADTQLVREGSSGKDGIKGLEKRLKKRVLTVNEVCALYPYIIILVYNNLIYHIICQAAFFFLRWATP